MMHDEYLFGGKVHSVAVALFPLETVFRTLIVRLHEKAA